MRILTELPARLTRTGTPAAGRAPSTKLPSPVRFASARLKTTGRRILGDPSAGSRPVIDAEARALRSLLSEVLTADAAGDQISDDDLLRLRRLALSCRQGDRDGVAIATLAILADHFDDQVARSWLPVALAHAGRFGAAADQELIFTRGRPRIQNYPILVTALHQLGRDAEAEQRLRFLQRKFRALPREFIDIWGDDQLSLAYRTLRARLASTDGALPVFQHLPFCAGSSMQFSLGLVVPWARTLQISRRWGLLQIEQAAALSPDETQKLMLVHQHHP
ncbi:MAG TPA: hypothetical protein VIP98_23910, partial [Microlunatus sp.]